MKKMRKKVEERIPTRRSGKILVSFKLDPAYWRRLKKVANEEYKCGPSTLVRAIVEAFIELYGGEEGE